jgi:2,4-dienoyl-CoA reductase-like NADH-dependent reductase (Old Yellow Enzyme family)
MASVFDSSNINQLTLNNRFIRSATASGMADKNGYVTPKLMNHIMELVEGEVGLIISGHISVHKSGQNSESQLCIYDDSHVSSLEKLVEKVHEKSGKIVAQLNHGGAHSNPPNFQGKLISSSATEKTGPNCRAMTKEDIALITKAFKEAAIRAKTAGFDGVQLHGAHGYLLSQFLSPLYNKRKDEYGGCVENRARFIVEIYKAIRESVSNEYPVLIKMNVTDFLEGGTGLEDALITASIFDKIGFDALELSGGVCYGWNTYGLDYSPCKTSSEEAYYLETARKLRPKIKTPLVLTGGIRSYELAERIIKDEDADYIGLSRPLLREPDLVYRWKSGNISPSLCIHDSSCLLCKGETVCYLR